MAAGIRRATGITSALALAAGLFFAGSAIAPAEAAAEEITLRWVQPEGADIAGFRVHVGRNSRDYFWTIPVGLPTPDEYGVYKKTVDLGRDPVVFVALSTFNSLGWVSNFSNERRIVQGSEPLTAPGKPVVILD